MNETTARLQRPYPRTFRLDENTEVSFRLMTPADTHRLVTFARALPEDDLLYLRMDITKLNVVMQWGQNIKEGRTVTVLAEVDNEIAGYVSLHHNEVTWQRHLGEVRLQVAPRYRARGLGRALAGEIFAIARSLGLSKLVAHMTPDQQGAIATVERLGFRREALLQNFVIDRSGQTRDLLVMSYDMPGRIAC
ncbi:MAG: GNAT family N-acetyltransferase [Deltaproteobacteria bacterium]|nr:GNAT family N-acetyltransferase [Deltaproteobacteria bacterium]